jgi:hypothetical protein
MNTSKKFQFKSIDVDAPGIPFRSPFSHNAYGQLYTRKEICDAWREETRLREAELSIYRNYRRK